jgi:hypothetical protein
MAGAGMAGVCADCEAVVRGFVREDEFDFLVSRPPSGPSVGNKEKRRGATGKANYFWTVWPVVRVDGPRAGARAAAPVDPEPA